jgi:hypothetical protein
LYGGITKNIVIAKSAMSHRLSAMLARMRISYGLATNCTNRPNVPIPPAGQVRHVTGNRLEKYGSIPIKTWRSFNRKKR